jgi:hypothetical protein
MIFYVLYNHFAVARRSLLSAACLGLRLQAGKAVSSELGKAECRKNYQIIVHSDSDVGSNTRAQVDHILISSFGWHLSNDNISFSRILYSKKIVYEARSRSTEGKESWTDQISEREREREMFRKPHSHL